MSPCGRMKDLHRFIRQCHSACADKFVRDLLCDITNMSVSDPQSSNMRHMVNVSAPSGINSNDLMVIIDSVFCFGSPYINLSSLRILS